MGQAISQTSFTDEEDRLYRIRLDDCLTALERMLASPGFGAGARSLGAELELVIVDEQHRALPICSDVLKQAADDRLTAEINRYNLEANLTPVLLEQDAFGKIEAEMVAVLDSLNRQVQVHNARIIPIGILPTLRPADLHTSMITPDDRYQTLSKQLRARRGEKFNVRLKGPEKVAFDTDTVAPEGANTSLQIHYRMQPERFVDIYNAVQLITPLLLGLGANSPFLLGRQVWDETRIGLFRQSIDGRSRRRRQLKYPARVHFGHGWLRHSALELFSETVHLYTPLLPICTDEDPLKTLDDGKTPKLEELAMQMGTVWPWNRPVFDAGEQPHVRLELRSLPAGPTPIDMLANAALALGLAEGLKDDIERLLHSMPYASLQRNLLVAARNGIHANLLWPSKHSRRLVELPLIEIARELMPTAVEGLNSMGISQEQQGRYLGVIDNRLSTLCNGATWQIKTFSAFRARGLSRRAALEHMVRQYADLSSSNLPVAKWPMAGATLIS